MSYIYSHHDLCWDGNHLRRRARTGRVVATILPDAKWPDMWRVRLPDGHLTDLVNRTRAKDAAVALALASLNPPLQHAA